MVIPFLPLRDRVHRGANSEIPLFQGWPAPPIDRSVTKVSARSPTQAPRALEHGVVTKAVR
ncbi:MAG: hypothetical protein L0Z46_02295 [Nitrospiraceae bacterium]|nr:hypothetical protein [Nitrospiraceae bacterium]